MSRKEKAKIRECNYFESIDNKTNCVYYDVEVLYKNNVPHDFLIGKELSNQGGSSITYNVYNGSNTESKYILKRIYIEQNDISESIDKFKREVDIQNLVSKTGYTDEIELAYMTDEEMGFVMKKYSRVTNGILSDSNIDLEYKKELLVKIRDGIREISELGVSHNDLHFDNIMLDENNNIKFIDFGIATIITPEEALKENNKQISAYLSLISFVDTEEPSGWFTETLDETEPKNTDDLKKLEKYWESIIN